MAIFSAVPPPEAIDHQVPNTVSSPPPQSQTPVAAHVAAQSATTGSVDIEAWTVSALESLSVSPIARGTGTPLAINLDEQVKKASAAVTIATEKTTTTTVQQTPIRRPLSRRDSQKKREQLLKGNEGSRARRRWENDRLIGVPNAQPPLPSDWEVHPTYPVQVVPYQVAQYWDTGLRQRIEEKTAKLQAQRKKQQRKDGSATGLSVGEVPRDLRDTAKRTPAVRGWVRVLEEPVRSFLKERSEASDAEGDSEDEEIVFVGRKGMASAGKGWKKARREVGSEKVDDGMVFDSLGDDESASFKYGPAPFLFAMFIDLGVLQAMVNAFHLGLLRSTIPLCHYRRACPPGGVRDGTGARQTVESEEAHGLASSSVGDVLRILLPVAASLLLQTGPFQRTLIDCFCE
ncbi:hypothetical protein CPAR01_04592 [Colletotrichum paranaense]|uniref:R3H-associated N-terminal domain-containing protein n=1 Tax=Colletotrichum paranaense TaxID=1914294 RepID=A0ABQ9SWV3_9PEZI|nr:uncharacterized protein CPAR01_04592 [Colletotrichum paranaense]KAK1543959.1 hypothetical protein CPAR01_04592 [Colletotrichum paranaense]